MRTVKKKFIDLIIKKGIKETSDLSGVSQSTIEKWVYGKATPTIDLAEKVLDALGQEMLIFDKK